MANNGEDIPYRTGVAALNPVPERVVSKDEEQYGTLRSVHDSLRDAVDALYKDFNAFTLLKGATRAEARDHLVAQIEANQIAYSIVAPLLESVRDAIKTVDEEHKE